MPEDKKQHDATEHEAPEKTEEQDATSPEQGEMHPADAADHIENLELAEQIALVQGMDLPHAAEAIAEMERHERIDLLEALPRELAAEILGEMATDDAADIFDDLDEELGDKILERIEREDREEIEALRGFDSDSAGGVMNTDALILDEKLTADQAITIIRREVADKDIEVPYYIYLVDEAEHLVGVLSMRDLLLAKPGSMLSDSFHDKSLVAVTFDVDREEVAHLISHYNFIAIPVVDYEDRLLGVVTVDDVIDIIHEEATEDMQTMVGAGADETVDTPWKRSVGKRLPWLLVNVANSAVSAYVVHLFEGTIEQMAFLAVLMPIVANQAGNTGQQALAVMIRQLALEKFDRRRSWLAVLREVRIGLANGLLIALCVLGGVMLVTLNPELSFVMALALLLDMVIGALAGSAIPLVMKELGRDPAQASSIFLTAMTDSLGFLFLLGLAQLFLV
jgi:magnesium transporter